MKNILLVAGGFVVGGAAGAGATYFIMKRKAEDYINEELEKIEKDEGTEIEDSDTDTEEEEEVQNEEEPIADLTEMANKVKSEEAEKTDYTAFSKSESDKKEAEKPMPKKAIEYVDEEKAYELETKNYDLEEMTAFSDGVLAFDVDDSKVDPKKLEIDLSKMTNDELYVVDHNERKVYAIVGVDDTYDNLVDNEEIEEDGQSEA